MLKFRKKAAAIMLVCMLVAGLGVTPAAALTDADIAALQAEFDAAMSVRDDSYTRKSTPETAPTAPVQQSQPIQTVTATEGWNYNEARNAFELQNKERINAGLDPLVWSDDLYRLACARAKEVSVSFSHERPGDHSPLWESQPYNLGWIGENIVAGAKVNADSAVGNWMNSEGHRAAILESRYQSGGIACYTDSNNHLCWSSLFSMENSPKISSEIEIQNTDGTTTNLPDDSVLFTNSTTK